MRLGQSVLGRSFVGYCLLRGATMPLTARASGPLSGIAAIPPYAVLFDQEKLEAVLRDLLEVRGGHGFGVAHLRNLVEDEVEGPWELQ